MHKFTDELPFIELLLHDDNMLYNDNWLRSRAAADSLLVTGTLRSIFDDSVLITSLVFLHYSSVCLVVLPHHYILITWMSDE